MNSHKKLTSRQQQQSLEQQPLLEQQQTQVQAACQFATVEEMLRHDAVHTPVPPRIAVRLQESINQLPAPPARPWWRRLLG